MLATGSVDERICAAGAALGLHVSRETLDGLVCFVDQLQKWNRTYNLTALRTLDDILRNHIFDCMSVIPAMTRRSNQKEFLLVDVGSGAGLPGLIIGLFFKEANVICIDSVEKKTAFIRHAAGKMNCKNVTAMHTRVEAVEPLGADYVISRAFASLTDFTSLAGFHCKPKGRLISMKSAQVAEDISDLSKSDSEWNVELLEELKVPEIEAKRYLVWLQRKDRA